MQGLCCPTRRFNARRPAKRHQVKGFRVGGVNPAVPPAQCATDLAALGITAVPQTFKGDMVRSYEAGAKMRVFNRVQLNTSAFLINWTDVQFNFALRCGFAFVSNAAKAQSKGAEVQAAGRFGPVTLGANIGYNKAEYSKMPPATRQRLAEYFAPENERLYRLLGERFDWDE